MARRQRCRGSNFTSPEYLTVVKCNKLLVDNIKQSVDTIGNALFSEGFISADVRDRLRMAAINPGEKATAIVDCMTDRVKYDKESYHKFVEILEQEKPWANMLLDALSDSFRSYSPPLQLSNHHAKGEDVSSTPFAHIGNGFVTDKCLEQFPYLDTPDLSDSDKEDLEARLIYDTKRMKTSFSSFTLVLRKSLEVREVALDKLADCVLSIDFLAREDTLSVQQAKSTAGIFLVLRPYVSFFNYEIMEHIALHLGSIGDHKILKEYLDSFREFCKRGVFEVPPNVFAPASRKEQRTFIVKCTNQVAATLEGVKEACIKLAEVLGINGASLQLCTIKKGCVELRFSLLEIVFEQIYPILLSKHNTLHKNGIRVVEPELPTLPDDQASIAGYCSKASVHVSDSKTEESFSTTASKACQMQPPSTKTSTNLVVKKLRKHPSHKKKTQEELEELGQELTNPDKLRKRFSHLLNANRSLSLEADNKDDDLSTPTHGSDLDLPPPYLPIKLSLQKIQGFLTNTVGAWLRHEYGPLHAVLEVGDVTIEWTTEGIVEPRFTPLGEYDFKADVGDQSKLYPKGIERKTEQKSINSAERAQMIDRLVDVIVEYNSRRKYNAINCNCQNFARDAMEALGITKPIEFSGRLQKYFEQLKQGKTKVPPELSSHDHLDDFTEANIEDLSKHDMEYLQCLYFKAHLVAMKKTTDHAAWDCDITTCKSDLLNKKFLEKIS